MALLLVIGRSVVYVRRCTGGYFDTAVYCCGCLQLKKAAFAGAASWEERFQALRSSFWGLLLPVLVVGGIYTGAFTPTELLL